MKKPASVTLKETIYIPEGEPTISMKDFVSKSQLVKALKKQPFLSSNTISELNTCGETTFEFNGTKRKFEIIKQKGL